MLATTKPISALELCEAVRMGRALDPARLNRILRLDAMHGLLEVQAATPWLAIAAELRPGDARFRVRTTMPTVGEFSDANLSMGTGRCSPTSSFPPVSATPRPTRSRGWRQQASKG